MAVEQTRTAAPLRRVVHRQPDAHSFDHYPEDGRPVYYEVPRNHPELRWYDRLECDHLLPGKGWGHIRTHTVRRRCRQCEAWGWGNSYAPTEETGR